ncbi:MAG: cyclic nucleotide-binding domain-containing protein [Roseburia sp.]|nr:cyclic nucleotide-binding domain-containing protein [Roseburia sp.]
MDIIEYQHDKLIAKKNDKVKSWYLIQQGTVVQKTEFSEIRLGKNAIIGFPEKQIYLCDYIAGEDTVLAAFTCENADDIKRILAGQEKIRNIFLRAAVEQRHQLLCLYSNLYAKARQFHTFVEMLYNDYKTFCSKYKIAEQSFPKMEVFKPLEMQHRAEVWEVNHSFSLVRQYMQEYLQLMEKDDSLTVGAIMEAAAQMRRFTLGIEEIEAYLSYNKEILIGEAENGLFSLFFNLAIEMHAKKYSIEPVAEKINLIAETAEKLQIYNSRFISRRLNEFHNYDYVGEASDGMEEEGPVKRIRKEIDITKVNCLSHILEYAGYQDEEADAISKMIEQYHKLPDMLSTDNEAYTLRKKITSTYYDIYYKVFVRAVKDESTLTPILEMFLNFGFMDMSLISEEQVKALYDLCAHLDICHSRHVYTIYEWLKCIYKGKKETSKNEFDKNYPAYLTELFKNGKITQEQLRDNLQNGEMRVEFEIKNMFTPVNKLTYGKVTTFCPVLCGNDLINSIEKMLVTAEKIEDALNEVRKIDYSVFYREVPFSDPLKGIANERVMKEILPDIILMPNAGTKAMMWQETAEIRSDTPGRFMFPIFTSVDLSDLMLEVIGRYRWEMCRKIEGVHWNDLREKSMTAEYCSYLQFYKKNNELSVDAKEKIKSALSRAKNNYREVFVRDYISWIKFEAKGSYRLNKLSRDILARYCPFIKSIRNELKVNPFYQTSITRFETEAARKYQRYAGVYNKYEKAGGENGEGLKETLLFYEM